MSDESKTVIPAGFSFSLKKPNTTVSSKTLPTANKPPSALGGSIFESGQPQASEKLNRVKVLEIDSNEGMLTENGKITKNEKGEAEVAIVIPCRRPRSTLLNSTRNERVFGGNEVADELIRESRSGQEGSAEDKNYLSENGLVIQRESSVSENRSEGAPIKREVPIAEFGMAMLRGMGYKEEVHGKVKPVENKPRPEGLGLGARALGEVNLPHEKK